MSLPLFVEPEIPTFLEIDLGQLCPAHDRYRIFSERVFPRLVYCRTVLEEDEAYCLDNGRAGIEPVWVLGVCLLQFMEQVSDRQALWLLKYHAGWNLALRRLMTEPVFHPTVLVYFRQRLLEHKQSDRLFKEILQGLVEAGLVSRRSAQRLDSTQMWGVIRQMNRLDCVRESLRLALEEIEGPAEVSARPLFWEELWDRYGEAKMDYKVGAAERKRQLVQAGQDALRLVSWAQGLTEATVRQGAQMQLLARVLDEQFEQKPAGVEARTELASDRVQNPHEPEAHYAVKGQGQQKKEHIGYRVQVAETAQEQALAPGQPTGQFLIDLVTQYAEQSDEAGAEQVAAHQATMAVMDRPPVQYVDGAYVSAERLAQAQTEGWELIGPAQAAPNNNEGRFTSEAFQMEVEQRRAVCPAGKESTQCSRLEEKATGKVSYRFEWSHHCADCPLRAQCVAPKQAHRTVVVGEHHSVLQARRQEQKTPAFQQRYQNRAGIEGTISELKRGHGLGQARYRGREKVSLQNYFIGAACNVKRWINQVVWRLTHPVVSVPVAVPSG